MTRKTTAIGAACVLACLGSCRSAERAERPTPPVEETSRPETPVPAPLTEPLPPSPAERPRAEEQPPSRDPLDRIRTGTQVFPFVRIDRDRRLVEIDGAVPIDAHDPETPDVFLELIACLPDTREHESLVVTRAKASHVHAALLMVGLEPGRPGAFVAGADGLRPQPPEGDPVDVRIAWIDANGSPREAPAEAWVLDVKTGEPMREAFWVFAGSRIVDWRGQSHYDADGAGNLVGLTTFGNEVVGMTEVVSPDSSIHEPGWIALRERVPKVGTPVVLRLQGAAE